MSLWTPLGNSLVAIGKKMGAKTPIEPAMIAAASGGGVNQTVGGDDSANWMSPGQPVAAQHMAIAGRRFDFPIGANLQYTPRANEAVSFAQLRALADGYDLLRLLIETRKDQLVKFEWKVAPIDEKQAVDKRCKDVTAFLRYPDRQNDWQTWLRAIVEDLLVTDAAALYPRMTRGGGVYALELMDGATLKPVMDSSGRRPLPPDVAYQQIIKGIPAVDYSADEVIYAPRNVRTYKLYGYSPVEQIIMTVNIGLRRQLSQLQAYTEGNVPEALISVPKEWSPKQIAEYQEYWDTLLEGNTAARRHAKFIPDSMHYYATKETLLKDPFDEWLARVCCYAFSLPPSPFVKDQNRSTTESAKEAATEEGLVPLMSWIKSLMNLFLVKYWGYADLEFTWEQEAAIDPLEAAKIQDIKVRNAVISIDEARQDDGLEPIGMGNAVFTGNGAQLVKDIINPPAVPAPTQVIAQESIGPRKDKPAPDAEKFAKAWESPTINVTSPPINITMPPMRAPDVLVEIAPTTITAHFDQPSAPVAKREKPVRQVITAERGADGVMRGVIETDNKRTFSATKDPNGVLKIDAEQESPL